MNSEITQDWKHIETSFRQVLLKVSGAVGANEMSTIKFEGSLTEKFQASKYNSKKKAVVDCLYKLKE